jgi:hypothetical protein
MTSNNTVWEKGWFYLCNDDVGLPPYTGKVLVGKPGAWFYGLSPPAQQRRLEPLTNTLRHLVDSGLGAASIITNFHHRRIIPLMERELRIFKMSDTANPTSLARSRLLQERFPKEYATTRARHVINLKVVLHSDDNLWSFVMLLDAQSVSTVFLPLCVLVSRSSVELTIPFAAGGRAGCPIRPADGPIPDRRPCRTAAGVGAGGSREGKEDQATRAPESEQQGVPAARAARALPSTGVGKLVIGRGGERRGADHL